ncbi:MAG: FecR domain-containing protein [Planctomycetes bacterium]|nr:FecR domain-containing protein [Planctomycetota bacterium]MBL7044316.1 FecR domain-containing protein [Pirellulaceae bacterium]
MNDELKALARAYGDGTISRAELQRLEELLQGDQGARGRFLHEMNLIDAMEERALGGHPELHDKNLVLPPATRSITPRFVWATWTSLAVVVAALLIFAGFIWLNAGSASIGTFVERHGPVRWTGQDGVVENDLEIGESLSGGTLEVLTADAWASFRFHDGSIVTLSGEAEVVLSDRDRKRLQLRHGSMSADVEPQPVGSPMIVQTPAAEIEVLGTQFNVSARTTDTELAVNEGRVRFLRSSDGKALDVSAEHRVVASLDPAEGFSIQPLRPQVATWQSRLESDSEVMHGYWKPALFELGIKLKQAVAAGETTEAEALAEYQQAVRLDSQGSVWGKPSKIGCLVWLDVRDEDGNRVQLMDQSKLRITGRIFAPAKMEMGVSTYKAEGGFHDKFSCTITSQELNRSPEGKFEWVVHASDLLPKSSNTPTGSVIHDWWCVTESNTSKFEIIRVEILDK